MFGIFLVAQFVPIVWATKMEPTNVLMIVRGLAPVDSEQVPQVVYYDTGVGTQGMADKYVGGGLGVGLSENIWRELFTLPQVPPSVLSTL